MLQGHVPFTALNLTDCSFKYKKIKDIVKEIKRHK